MNAISVSSQAISFDGLWPNGQTQISFSNVQTEILSEGTLKAMTEPGRYISESTVMDKSSWDTPRKSPVSLNGCVFQSPISHFDTLSPFQCCNHVSTEHVSTLKRGRGGFGYRQKRCFLKLRKDAQAFVLLKCVNTFVHDCRSVRSFTSWLTRPRLSMLQSVCRFNQVNVLFISNLIVIYGTVHFL